MVGRVSGDEPSGMTTRRSITRSAAGVLLLRQLFVLRGVRRSCQFISESGRPTDRGLLPRMFVTIPVLREAALLGEAVDHFVEMATRYGPAEVVIVTTEREVAEHLQHPDAADTVALARELAQREGVRHVHSADEHGLKGDQLNLVVRGLVEEFAPIISNAFLVVYDVDSRPPHSSLADLAESATRNPSCDVFHQSSRFRLRRRPGAQPLRHRLPEAICDACALHANRFVSGFELPRLLNLTDPTPSRKRRRSRYVYAHVTSHGLCVRLQLLEQMPFPGRTPLEDMRFSFHLGSRGVAMTPVRTLDVAEVPDSVKARFEQAARWFVGPARALDYLHDEATENGFRARVQAISALGSALEWLGCAVVPPLVMAAATSSDRPTRAIATAVVGAYALQLLETERHFGQPDPLVRRGARIVLAPAASIVHGAGGFKGAWMLARGLGGEGKTERSREAA
jgi:hypothetical protein